ncbi:MAG TPA: polysaccharide deacetylase family protein [Candidatus Saccharimonadales bacterium]
MNIFKIKRSPKPLWQRRNAALSICFTALTLLYVVYRVAVLGGAGGVGSLVVHPQHLPDIGCLGEHLHEVPAKDRSSISSAYQHFLRQQRPISGNLIPNTELVVADPDIGPRNFYRTTENNAISYSVLQDSRAGERFLRVSNTQASKGQKGTWVSEFIPVAADASYRYAFEYRADVKALVTLEYKTTKDTYAYETAAVLPATAAWQRFTGYMGNHRDMLAFRFVITTETAGQLDSRRFITERLAPSGNTNGIVTISFDDGWQSIADVAIPLLDGYGFKTTQFIISEAAKANMNEYMNMPTLRKLHRQGHEIGSHSMLHCNQAALSSARITSDAAESKAMLERQKLGPIKAFAYPYGIYSDQTQSIYARQYPLVRTSDQGYNDAYFDAGAITTFAVNSDTPDMLIQSWLEHARTHKLWVVLVYHHVDEKGLYSVTASRFKEQLQLIQKSGLPVMTLSDAAARMRP